ncbi:glycosyltransferase family 2 protein [Ekhidna sp.]|uniref:glycosyltransferase family 2 protein n=1 Tax=Ekhidna sp. TaxID=2608089 RepID=UPI003BAC6119
MNKPLLSVCIQTYNHERYVSQCLESVLNQKTDFDFEIIIGEDESTDGTRTICKVFEEKYPKKINLFLRSRKDVIYVNGRPTGRFNMIANLQAARGKYIALVEGDDFWTDQNKLQKQIDLLESRPELSFCFHNVHTLDQSTQKIRRNTSLAYSIKKTTYDQPDIIAGTYVYNTLSLVFRNNILIPEWFKSLPYGDKPLVKLLGLQGSAYFFEEAMGVYRDHSHGTTKSKEWKELSKNHVESTLLLYSNLLQEDTKYVDLIRLKIHEMLFLKHMKSKPLMFRLKFAIRGRRLIKSYAKIRYASNIHRACYFGVLVSFILFDRSIGIFNRFISKLGFL